MNRSTLVAITAAILMAPVLGALPSQPQAAGPSFEVATIKPFKASAAGGPILIGGGCRGIDSVTAGPGAGGQAQATILTVGGPPPGGAGPGPGGPGGGRFNGPNTPIGRCVFNRMSLRMLINAAYRLTATGGSLDQLLTGGPDWANTDGFDIEAKAEDTEHATQDQLRLMLQNLLAERFKLKFHREQKETQGFDLVVAKGGLKMKEAPSDAPGGMSMSIGNPATGGLSTAKADGSTMASIIGFLSQRLGRAIQDKTGLTAKYNFNLSWSPGDNESNGLAGIVVGPRVPTTAAADAPEPGGSIFTALQEQLGLRLETTKVKIDALIIDSAEKPEGL